MGFLTGEVANLLLSSAFGSIMQIMGAKSAAQAEMMKNLTNQHKLEEISRDKVRNNTNSFFQMTRRIVVLSAMFSIILVPSLAPIMFDVPIFIQVEVQSGSDWLLFDTRNTTYVWKEITGIPILEWHKHIMISIVSMYLGSSISKAR